MGLLLGTSLTVLFLSVLRDDVAERAARFTQSVQMAGLSPLGLLLGQTAFLVARCFAASVICSIFLSSFHHTSHINFLIIFFFVFFTTTAIVASALVLASLFNRLAFAIVVGLVMHLTIVSVCATASASHPPAIAFTLISLLPQSATALGMAVMMRIQDGSSVTVDFSNMSDPSLAGIGWSVSGVIIAQMLNTVVYGLLALYLNQVLPKQHGASRSACFPCIGAFSACAKHCRSCLCPGTSTSGGDSQGLLSEYDAGTPFVSFESSGPILFESQKPSGSPTAAGAAAAPAGESVRVRKAGISVRDLTKTFQSYQSCLSVLCCCFSCPRQLPSSVHFCCGSASLSQVRAVRGISFDVLAGQVMCLLGPNGSGKTTTMHMLCGMLSVTDGTGTVCGHSINDDMLGVRRQLGVCLQHDAHMPDLTVAEHLQLFARIRGVEEARAPSAVSHVLAATGLTDKADAAAGTLSGGQSRRLSLACAAVGNPSALLLDEPTTGCDAAARREIWAVLSRLRRGGAAIIISSHDMHECEILADRVCVIGSGSVLALGTPQFLKHNLCAGYRLSIELAAEADAKSVVAVIRGRLPAGVEVLSSPPPPVAASTPAAHHEDVAVSIEPQAAVSSAAVRCEEPAAEMVLQLPAGCETSLADLCDALDSDALPQVLSFGLSSMTLEEAFSMLVEMQTMEQPDHVVLTTLHESNAALELMPAAEGAAKAASTRRDDLARRLHAATERQRTARRERRRGAAARAAAAAVKETHQTMCRQAGLVCHRRFLEAKRSICGMALRWGVSVVVLLFVVCIVLTPEHGEAPDWSNGLIHPVPITAQSLVPDAKPPLTPGATPTMTVPFWASGASAFVPPLRLLAREALLGTPSRPGLSELTGGVLQPVDDSSIYNGSLDTAAAADLVLGPADHPAEGFNAGVALWSVLPEWRVVMHLAYNQTFPTAALIMLQELSNTMLSVGGIRLQATAQMLAPPNATVEPGSYSGGQNPVAALMAVFGGVVALLFIPALAGYHAASERLSGVLEMERLAGMSIPAYWLGTVCWEVLGVGLPAVGMFAISVSIAPFVARPWQGDSPPPYQNVALALIAAFMVTSGTAQALALSRFVNTPSRVLTFIISQPFLCIIVMAVMFLTSAAAGDFGLAFAVSDLLGVLTPAYCGVFGMVQLIIPALFGNRQTPPPLSWDGGGKQLATLGGMTIVWLLVLLVKERHSLAQQLKARAALATAAPDTTTPARSSLMARRDALLEDDDVRAERVRAAHTSPDSVPLLLRGVIHEYSSGTGPRTRAVGGVDLVVPEGEILGLLGPNGAGKTTLQRILTGALAPTSGALHVRGWLEGGLGYCPQRDCLFQLLTGRETAEHFLALSGVAASEVAAQAASALVEVTVDGFADRLVYGYSGGNQRKLSLAIAYLSSPGCVLLDEASAGVDILARRRVWELVRERRGDRATVVTTHLLEEAEALCSRIGIMVEGTMVCIGSPQRLRRLYGKGVFIDCAVTDSAATASTLREALGSGVTVEIDEEHLSHVRFRLEASDTASGTAAAAVPVAAAAAAAAASTPGHLDIGAILRCLTSIPTIASFSVTQPSLQSIFLQFTSPASPTPA